MCVYVFTWYSPLCICVCPYFCPYFPLLLRTPAVLPHHNDFILTLFYLPSLYFQIRSRSQVWRVRTPVRLFLWFKTTIINVLFDLGWSWKWWQESSHKVVPQTVPTVGPIWIPKKEALFRETYILSVNNITSQRHSEIGRFYLGFSTLRDRTEFIWGFEEFGSGTGLVSFRILGNNVNTFICAWESSWPLDWVQACWKNMHLARSWDGQGILYFLVRTERKWKTWRALHQAISKHERCLFPLTVIVISSK